MYVEIRIKEHLASDWANWLEDAAITPEAGGGVAISGQLADQAALLGLLNRLHALNLTIVSVSCRGHDAGRI